MCNFVAFLCVACVTLLRLQAKHKKGIFIFLLFFGLSDRIIIGAVCQAGVFVQ